MVCKLERQSQDRCFLQSSADCSCNYLIIKFVHYLCCMTLCKLYITNSKWKRLIGKLKQLLSSSQCKLVRLSASTRVRYHIKELNYILLKPLCHTSFIANLRGLSTRLNLPPFNLECMHRSFSFLASRLWNALPPLVRESKDIASFKRSLTAHMARGETCF